MTKPVLYARPDCEYEPYTAWCEVVVTSTAPTLDKGYGFWLDQDGLGLLMPGYARPFRLSAAELERRGRGRTLLRRACGAGEGVCVLDPFAGYGMDAFHLVGAGCVVTTVERHLAPWLLARDFGRREGLLDPERMHLGDGLARLQPGYDVIYLDPMFPRERKRALPNRGLQHLRALVERDEPDITALLARAREVAGQRVVLKRRLRDPVAATPSHQLKGRSVRFDVYV